MHYYQFNIGDYTTHTLHLDDLEDLAYRRMLDWYYLHESPLPDSVDQIAKFIRMRTHTESIANVLHEFFTLTEYGYQQKKVDEQIKAYQIKSEKAKASAAARWSKKPIKSDANALPPQSDSNANHKPITNNQEPVTKLKDKSTKADKIPYKKIAELYNEVCTNLPKVLKPENLNDKRKRAIRKFWNNDKDNQNSDFFANYFYLANQDPFFCGFNNNDSHSNWKADIEFLMRVDTYDKFMERQHA